MHKAPYTTLYFRSLALSLALSAIGCAGVGIKKDEDASFRASDGLYLRGSLISSDLSDGEFDGNTALAGSSEVVVIPSVRDGDGQAFAIGWRERRLSLEFEYANTDSDGSVLGVSGFDVTRETYDLNWRINFFSSHRFQPFLAFGVGYMTAKLNNAGTDGVSVFDSDLGGFSLPIGLGLEVFATSHFSGELRFIKRFGSYTSADGIPIDGSIDGNSTELGFGLTLTF